MPLSRRIAVEQLPDGAHRLRHSAPAADDPLAALPVLRQLPLAAHRRGRLRHDHHQRAAFSRGAMHRVAGRLSLRDPFVSAGGLRCDHGPLHVSDHDDRPADDDHPLSATGLLYDQHDHHQHDHDDHHAAADLLCLPRQQ